MNTLIASLEEKVRVGQVPETTENTQEKDDEIERLNTLIASLEEKVRVSSVVEVTKEEI